MSLTKALAVGLCLAAFGAGIAPAAAQSPPYDIAQLGGDVRIAVDSARAARASCAWARTPANARQFKDGVGYRVYVSAEGVWYGCAVYAFANGDTHTGIWGANGTFTNGVYEFADGRRYEGQFMNVSADGYDMQRSGYGVMWSADGRILQSGAWSAGALVSSSR